MVGGGVCGGGSSIITVVIIIKRTAGGRQGSMWAACHGMEADPIDLMTREEAAKGRRSGGAGGGGEKQSGSSTGDKDQHYMNNEKDMKARRTRSRGGGRRAATCERMRTMNSRRARPTPATGMAAKPMARSGLAMIRDSLVALSLALCCCSASFCGSTAACVKGNKPP